jgi:hypothetical protein
MITEQNNMVIQFNGLTIEYIRHSSGAIFSHLTVDNNSDTIYYQPLTPTSKQILPKNKIYVNIRDIFYNEIIRNIDNMINESIDNIEFYKPRYENESRFLLGHLNITSEYTIHEYNNDIPKYCDFSNVDTGVVSLNIGCSYVHYNFLTQEFSCTFGGSIIPIYEMLSNQFNMLTKIAFQQYLNGTASKGFKEIIEVNNFLKDKKSITVILKTGEQIKLKHRYNDPLNCDIVLNDGLWGMMCDVSMNGLTYNYVKTSEIDSLKYRNTVYKINYNRRHIQA